MAWERRAQRIQQAMLDLMIGGRDPEFLGDFQTSNELARALSHLVATDGRFSRLLRCSSAGVLRTIVDGFDAVASVGKLRVMDQYHAQASILVRVITTTVGIVDHELHGEGACAVVRVTAAVGDCELWFGPNPNPVTYGPYLVPERAVLLFGLKSDFLHLGVRSHPTGTAGRSCGIEEFSATPA